MSIYILYHSRRSGKKYAIVDPCSAREIHFGDPRYEDFTQHNDEDRKENYLARHAGQGEDWEDPSTAGFWARWLLWNKPTLPDSIEDTERRFKLSVILENEKLLKNIQC